MEYRIRDFKDHDSNRVIDIFNHYTRNGFAAYTEEVVDYGAIELFREMTQGYPFVVIETEGGALAGFAFLRPFHRMEVFSRAAEITYFILPAHTRRGLGEKLLEIMTEEARRRSIDTILASISSLNEPSILFHEKNGFIRCGCFKAVGKKFNRDFDMIWMQKQI
jgi:L-amino acid N-acyltransferase YncA